MNVTERKSRWIGGLMIVGVATGILSIVPAIDTTEYLTEAARNVNQTAAGALFQFTMAIVYVAIAVLFFPILEKHGKSLAIGFVSLRLIAASLVIFGAILLASLLAISQEFGKLPSRDPQIFEVLGQVLKAMRDHTNHVYMILALCCGNALMYVLLIKSRLVPRWITVWGLVGIVLTGGGSILILFQVLDVISVAYLALNAPTALLEIVFALWLLIKGLGS